MVAAVAKARETDTMEMGAVERVRVTEAATVALTAASMADGKEEDELAAVAVLAMAAIVVAVMVAAKVVVAMVADVRVVVATVGENQEVVRAVAAMVVVMVATETAEATEQVTTVAGMTVMVVIVGKVVEGTKVVVRVAAAMMGVVTALVALVMVGVGMQAEHPAEKVSKAAAETEESWEGASGADLAGVMKVEEKWGWVKLGLVAEAATVQARAAPVRVAVT